MGYITVSDDPPILRETVGSVGMIGILQMVRNASDIQQLNAPARDVAKSHQKKKTPRYSQSAISKPLLGRISPIHLQPGYG